MAGQEGVDGVARVRHRDLALVFLVVDAAREAQLPLPVEDEDVRGRHRTVLERHGLGLAVVEVGEHEAVLASADLHLVEGVAEVGVAELVETDGQRVVRGDRDHRHPLGPVVRVQLLDPLLVGLGGRTVVRGEDQHQELGVGEAPQRVPPAVHPGQVEIGSGRADGKRGDGGAVGGRRHRSEGKKKRGGQARAGHHTSRPPARKATGVGSRGG